MPLPKRSHPLLENPANRLWLQAAWIWVLAGLAGHLLAALERTGLAAPGWPCLAYGRLSAAATAALLLGLGGNLAFAAAALALRDLAASRPGKGTLALFQAWIWQGIVAATVFVRLRGGDIRFSELAASLSAGVSALLFARALFRCPIRPLHPALWFHAAALCALPFGLALPPFSPEAEPVRAALSMAWRGPSLSGFMLFFPVLGILHHLLPTLAGRPVPSHRLVIAQFWMLAILLPWSTPALLLHSPVSEGLQSLGVVARILSAVAVWGGVAAALPILPRNLFRSQRNPSHLLVAALVFLAGGALAAALLAVGPIDAIAGFTDAATDLPLATTLGGAGCALLALSRQGAISAPLRRRESIGFFLVVGGILALAAAATGSGAIQGFRSAALDATGDLAHPDLAELVPLLLPWRLLGIAGLVAGLAGFLFVPPERAGTDRDESTPFRKPLAPPAWREEFEGIAAASGPIAALQRLHQAIECRPAVLMALILLALAGGSLAMLAPRPESLQATLDAAPLTPLERMGLELYRREGCRGCHTQLVRPLLADVLREGPPSRLGETLPDLWGAARVGPDLARVAERLPTERLARHLLSPDSVVAGSSMPAYPWLGQHRIDTSSSRSGLAAPDGAIVEQAGEIAGKLSAGGHLPDSLDDREIVALVAFLRRLGTPPDSLP